MRESNFAFPAQNKACVCITSQLYDRRALDTSSPLPLFNSLTHLTYLTSTSPRIREIMTMDGGLERLVRILHDFCMTPPPPASPAAFYGLLPSTYRAPRAAPQLNPAAGQFDKHAAYRFSLAFQCVVNIGVRGSEPIRSRVVQAGTLDVVGCILEAWLTGRGFAVGPSTSATGLPRETREARASRRAAATARGRLEAAARERLDQGTEPALLAIDTYIPSADDIESVTPIVRDRSATVVRHGPRENANAHIGMAPPPPYTVDDMYALGQLHAAQPQPAPPSPSLSVTSTTSARGSPSSTASTGARTRSRASSVASPITISRASPVSSTVSSSRASPSPSTRTDTDTDGDGDVEMVSAGVAGLGVAGTTTATDGRRGVSSASASPSPPPLNRAIQTGEQAPPATMNMNMNLNMNMNMNMMTGMMPMMGLTRDPRIAGVEDGMGIQGMGIGGEEGMEGDAANMMLNMGMMNADVGMLGLDGGMGMMMNMNMNMNMNMGINMGQLGMMGGMPLGMDVSGSGAESDTRADTDADAEESDAGTTSLQTQTPRAGLVRLPSASPPEAGPSGTSTANDEDDEEGEVVAAIRGNASNAGTMRRTGTVRAASSRSLFPEPAGSTNASGRVASNRDRADTTRQPPPSATATTAPLRQNTTTTTAPTRTRQTVAPVPAIPPLPTTRAREREDRHHHNHVHPTGPYRDEDVLLSLQLLAYLSKYPHVRQAFYKKRNGFHPASPLAVMAARAQAEAATAAEMPKPPEIVREGKGPGALGGSKSQLPRPPEIVREGLKVNGRAGTTQGTQQLAFLRALGVSSSAAIGKEKEKGKGKAPARGPAVSVAPTPAAPAPTTPNPATTRPGYETNVFSLVERFTFRPSSSETDLPNPPPRLPPEIQYWAGVIMRNACRKDDSRGGIRQCANMLCGRWEEYPREFAKCRRCRKAKYCGKECQSTAWSEGHRFWCSAKEGDDPAPDANVTTNASSVAVSASIATITTAVEAAVPERRDRRDRTTRALLVAPPPSPGANSDTSTIRGFSIPIQVAAGAVVGGAPVTATATAGPSTTRRTMIPVRQPANPHPLGPIGSPAPSRRERERGDTRDMSTSFATFDTYMAERHRHEAAVASASVGALHHPQPQNPASRLTGISTWRRAADQGGSGGGDTSTSTSSSTAGEDMVLE